MTVDLIRSNDLTAAAPYAYASVVTADSLVFTAGACPLDDDGVIGPPGDVAGQAARVMDNLVTALAAAGAALTDVAKTTVYVATADRADLTAAWAVVAAAFGDHDAPSTLLAVPVLGWPGQLVEVEAVAAVSSAPAPG
jgi:enamine deaminase RidA (YjgF/YER057c/UK114 family)